MTEPDNTEHELIELKNKADALGYVVRKKPVPKAPKEKGEKLYVYVDRRKNGAFLFALTEEKLPNEEHDIRFLTSNPSFISTLVKRGIIEMEEEEEQEE